MESRYRDSDRQIYVNSVFWYILLFWKRIIAVTVIMAVVVMGFGSVTAYLKEKKAIKDAPVVDYEAMAKDETVIRALSVKKQYDEFEKNYYNDYVNNIDSSNVSKVTIQYNISGASNIDDLMENYKIFVAGEEVNLTTREFNIIYKMLSYPNKTFSRMQLMDEFWGVDSETSLRAVDVYVTKLRDKLSACDGFTIKTVRGLGYKAVLM